MPMILTYSLRVKTVQKELKNQYQVGKKIISRKETIFKS